MPHVRYTVEQQVFMYSTYMKSGYAGNLRRKYQHKCQDIIVARAENIHGTVSNLKQTVIIRQTKETLSAC